MKETISSHSTVSLKGQCQGAPLVSTTTVAKLLPVYTTPAANLPQVSTTQAAETLKVNLKAKIYL